MKTITEDFYKIFRPCETGERWLRAQDTADAETLVNRLITHNIDWANWLIARCLTPIQRIQYAIYAAEQVIEICEKKHPDDHRPRQALNAAKAVLKNNNTETRKTAAYAANAAANAAGAAAAYAGAAAAYAAANAADAAAYVGTTLSAACAAGAAAAAANAADAAARAAMKRKIVIYGIDLLKESEGA